MCGICGAIAADPTRIEASVASMMRSLHHRGPDDGGHELLPLGPAETGPFAGLGFRRLSILDLSPAGHQPMVNPATGDCLVFNGEIYNFRDLRAELAARGATFRSSGDTEVLLQALSTWGEAALERIQGMFALAFYHAATRRLLLARDPLGIKPLYVARGDRAFVFASEVRAVQASGLVASDLDVAGIAGMLAYGAVQSPRTVFRAIRSFPAGCCQWIDAEAASGDALPTERRFWNFAPRPAAAGDPPAVIGEVRRLLHAAVGRHLVADVPAGVFLSAGIDSTIVAALARECSSTVTAFTVGFDAAHGADEVPIAAATAARLGIRHHTVSVGTSLLLDRWHQWLAAMDSPSVDGFNTFVVSRCLREDGAVVALSGLGADELFGGYSTFAQAPRLARLVRAFRFVPPSFRSAAVGAIGRLTGRGGAADKLADLVAADPSVAGVTRSLRRVLASRSLAALRLPAAAVGLRADYLDAASPHLAAIRDGDEFNDVSRTELTHYMGDTLLRDTDANGMRHSLEVRVPFLDLPLVDFVSALAGSAKHPAGSPPKWLLREAGADALTDAVSRRAKTGFTLPIGDWMRRELREPCAAAVDAVAGLPFVEGREVRRVWNAFLADGRAFHWSRPLAIVTLGTYLMRSSPP